MKNIAEGISDIERGLANVVCQYLEEGIIILNDQFKILFLNPCVKNILKYDEEELIGSDISLLFSDEIMLQKILQTAMKEGSWEGSLLQKNKDGQVIISWVKINKIKESSHSPVHYSVIFRDTNKHKLSVKERQLADKVFECTSEGILVTDERGRIISINPAFQLVTGYSEEEILGKNPSILQSGVHDSTFYKDLWNSIKVKGHWKGEIWNKRKNGDLYPEWLTISTIKDELGNVTNFVGIFSDITDRKEAEEQLRRLAHFDSLTGVANRYSLNQHLHNLILTAEKYEQQLAVLFLDLDRFKHINDTLGHNYGDMLLKSVSGRLKSLVRNKDMIARLGGDEFVIALPNINHVKDSAYIAQRIIESLNKPFQLGKHEVFISTSIGISVYPFDGTTFEELLRNADKAMYVAKNNGKNQFEFYHSDMHRDESRQILLEKYMRKSLEKNEFFLVYHPQMDTKTKQINGVEALIRWNQEEIGIVSPGEFIPIAEETGLIIPISEWVIKQACEDLHSLHVNGFPHLTMSINISPLHFNQPDFVERLLSVVQETNIKDQSIELELTEGIVMPNAPETLQKLVKLKQRGIKLSIDDFGTGYSSLSYLNRFPIDILKIDQSFIRKLSDYKEDASIVKAIITMAHTLHLKVIAEGVETKKQLEFLEEQLCDSIQGFYITKPLPFVDLIKFLRDSEVGHFF